MHNCLGRPVFFAGFDRKGDLCYTILQIFTGCECVKKILSVFLAALFVIGTAFAVPVTATAATRQHVTDALETLQTKTGFIPGKTAKVTGNCFGFVSAVCKELYGVTYYNEQMRGSYRYNHTENYYTVASKTFSAATTAAKQKTVARQVMDFILDNAAAGDVISYGCANDSTRHMHTAMVQYVDTEKILLYHSNYASGNYTSAACHVDTVYWDSFLDSSNTNIKDKNGDVTSLNKFFGAPMNCSNGLGLSLNRYSKLTSKYYLDECALAAPTVSTERKSCTSIRYTWNAIDGAEAYIYSVTDAQGKSVVKSRTTTDTTATVTGLTTGEKYTFTVTAKATDRSGQSASKILTCLPPAPSKPQVSAGDGGITVRWTTRSDVDGYQVFRSTAKNGTFALIATVTDPTQNTYVDDEIKINTAYYYKVRRYVHTQDGDTAYSNRSTVTDGVTVQLGTPTGITTTRTGTTAIRMNWQATEHAVKYTVAYRIKGSGKWTYFTTKACNYTFKNLKVKSTYQFRVQAVSLFGAGAYSAAVSKQALPPTPGSVQVQRISAKSAKISWSKSQGFTGYYILRATDKNFKKNVKKITVKSNKVLSYTDKTVKTGTRYYYKVCRYTGKNSGSYSKVVSVKI